MASTPCTAGSISCWIASQADILTNLSQSLPPIERLVTGSSYLIGLAFVLKAIYSLRVYGESRSAMSQSTSIKEPLAYLLIGVILVYFPTALGIFMQTSFGYQNVLEYAPVNTNDASLNALFGPDSAVGRPLAMLMQVIGLIAFIRGWILIARSASQGQPPGGTGKGFMHVIGGILAINIVGTVDMINNTLYGG